MGVSRYPADRAVRSYACNALGARLVSAAIANAGLFAMSLQGGRHVCTGSGQTLSSQKLCPID